MKRELRNILASMSVMAIAASCTTFFTGCSKDDDEEKENNALLEGGEIKHVDRVVPVNDDNVQELSQKASSGGTNAQRFAYKHDEEAVKKLLEAEDLEEIKEVTLDSFKLYKKENGHYFVIDKEKAFELVNTANGYSFLSDSKGHTVLTNESGGRVLVFGGDEAYNEFVAMLKEKLDAVSSEVCTIINGVYVGEHIDSMSVDTYNGEMKYYDLEAVLNNCINAIKEYDYLDPISFVKNDDGSYDVTRFAYDYVNDNGNNRVDKREVTVNVPVGDKGEIYYDSTINYMIGMPFAEDGKTWISSDALLNLLGIDVVEGVYTIPGTEDAYNALMIDTAGGRDEPQFVKQSEIVTNKDNPEETPVVETQETILGIIDVSNPESFDDGSVMYTPDMYDEYNHNAPEDTPTYDQALFEATGIQATLSGEPAEQAHQYFDALNNAYPGHFIGDDSGVGLLIDDAKESDAWSIGLDGCDAKVASVLAGRNYTDVPIGELLAIREYAMNSNSYKYVADYLSNLFTRTFAPGHAVEW